MDIFKIIAVGIITVICAVILKQVKPELAIMVSIAGSLTIVLLILSSVTNLFGSYRNLLEKTGLSGNLFTCVLKVIGVGYLVEFSSGICVEAGVSSVANKILLAGKVLILMMCMPVLQSLIDVVLKLVP